VDDDWLATFEDPQLEALVAEALNTQNPNLRILSAQVDRATAAARLAGAALKPTVALGGDLSGVSWEADVWGRVQAGVNAAEESLRATVADFEFARQSLIAGVAKSWYLATELRLQAELSQEVVDLLTESVTLVEKKQQVGQVSMQDVFLVRADLASAEDALQQAISGQQQIPGRRDRDSYRTRSCAATDLGWAAVGPARAPTRHRCSRSTCRRCVLPDGRGKTGEAAKLHPERLSRWYNRSQWPDR
jgi:hypothetical protein